MRDGHLEETLRRIIADSLIHKVKDPRIAFVTINEVRLSRDKTIAQVFFTVMGTEVERRKSFQGLKSCSSFLQSIIGDTLRLRNVPKLHFRYDDSLDRSFRLDEILNELHTSARPDLGGKGSEPEPEPEPEPENDVLPPEKEQGS